MIMNSADLSVAGRHFDLILADDRVACDRRLVERLPFDASVPFIRAGACSVGSTAQTPPYGISTFGTIPRRKLSIAEPDRPVLRRDLQQIDEDILRPQTRIFGH
jgi:hypothetical protein